MILHLSNRSTTVSIVAGQSFICPVQGGTLVFLVVDPPSPPNSLPGSYFTIYGTKKQWQRFDGHTVGLFWSSSHRLAFFFFCVAPVSSVIAKILTKVDIAYLYIHFILFCCSDEIKMKIFTL
jgi:hypothetical protein